MSSYWRATISFILSLFLLASSPLADLSTNIRGSGFNSAHSENFALFSSPEKAQLPELEVKFFEESVVKNTTDQATERTENQTGDQAPKIATPTFDHISIAGNTIPLFTASPKNNYLPDSGSKVGVYRNQFFYGHNTPGVFGNLAGLSTGDTFTVTRAGRTSTYVVRVLEVLPKSALDHSSSAAISTLSKIYTATYRGSYDISLMTCAGTVYGNGDASHRLVIMASRI